MAKSITFNVLKRDASGRVEVADKLAKMDQYTRRSIYRYESTEVAPINRRVFWQSETGPCEGVSVAFYVA